MWLSLVMAMFGAATPAPARVETSAPADVIRYRQTVMRSLSSHLKALSQLAARTVSFAKHAPVHSQAVVELSKMMSELFPKGSGGGDSDALDAVWKNPKGWNQALEKMQLEAEKLAAAAASPDLIQLRAQVEATNDACAACHKAFRAGSEK